MSTIYRVTQNGNNYLESNPTDRSVAYYISRHDGITRNKLITYIRCTDVSCDEYVIDETENKEKISRSIDYYISKAFDDGLISYETNKRIMNGMRAYL